MLSPELREIAIIILAALGVGGIVYVLIYPYISGEKKTDKRIKNVAQASRQSRAVGQDASQNRRKQVQDTLKELEAKQKARQKITLRTRLTRAGLTASPRFFYVVSALFGAVVAAGIMITGSPIYVAGTAGAVAAVGVPRWFLSFLAKRRQKQFVDEFANAIDIIVRGVKSGLPLNDCLQIIAAETPEPVKTEFAELVEQQRIGVPLSQGFDRMYERMPLQEVNFFSIVIAIQQQAGGNLAEALGNLSVVLRGRKKLEGKIKAFSAEAKSSAAIIGALPLIVLSLVYMTTPDYIALLWKNPTGRIMLAGSALWMTCGVLVMRKMINFDY